MGSHTPFEIAGRAMRLWRMPSSSRAFPMKLEAKASYYSSLMKAVGIAM
jgi:hypothetical protein